MKPAPPVTTATHTVLIVGVFVRIEGVDGSGKSTQARLPRAAPGRLGRDVVATREPGGTELGERFGASS